MARVLAISSQTVFGPVGNSASVPALQAEGHEVLALPTILLSFHPGHGKPSVSRTSTALLSAMLDDLERLEALSSCAAVLTGYFADAEQIAAVAAVLAKMKQRNAALMVLVDPVLGDDGALYVPGPVAEALRERLLPLATIATPNAFELSFLTGMAVTDERTATAAAHRLALPECLVTSVPAGADLATLLVAGDAVQVHSARRLAAVPHGTGDFLAGLYLAQRLAHPPKVALARAMARLEAAISASAGSPLLQVN